MALRMVLYDANWRRVGAVEAVTSIHGTSVCNGTSSMSFDIDNDISYAAQLTTAGTRIELFDDGVFVEAFWVKSWTETLPTGTGKVTVQCAGYGDLLSWLIGYPEPTKTIPAGTSAKFATDYDTRGGRKPFETAAKGAIGDACKRLGLPVTVAPDLGRGPKYDAQIRVGLLSDVLYDDADVAGMNITVAPTSTHNGYLVDVVPRPSLSFVLSERSSLIVGGTVKVSAPTATRVIVGGQGEKADRTFYYQVATDAREADWGVVREMFRDARDAKDDPTLAARAADSLATGAPKYELSLDLAETATFRWRNGYQVGDQVTVRVGDALVTDWIRSVDWAWNNRDGFTATPSVGDRKGDATQQLIHAVAAGQRRDRAWKAGT